MGARLRPFLTLRGFSLAGGGEGSGNEAVTVSLDIPVGITSHQEPPTTHLISLEQLGGPNI